MIIYNGNLEILIVKLMVGVVHECVAREFACMFEEKLLFQGVFKSIRMVGPTRFGGPSRKSKEVDVSYKPCFVT
jgi:hypothetical protein